MAVGVGSRGEEAVVREGGQTCWQQQQDRIGGTVSAGGKEQETMALALAEFFFL